MGMGYVEVEPVADMICCECGCPEESTTMRYVYLDKELVVRAYCADHYRAYMIAVHGEETVTLLEETGDYGDAVLREEN